MKSILLVTLAVILTGCGPSKKDLLVVNDLLEKSKTVDCETIHSYLDKIQEAIQSKIK